jgi:hypothetical protein
MKKPKPPEVEWVSVEDGGLPKAYADIWLYNPIKPPRKKARKR